MDQTRYTLIERLQNPNDTQAWETFVDAYQDYILAVFIQVGIHHDDAMDLRQEVLLKLWNKLPESPYASSKGKFRTWLYQVIKNAAFNYSNARRSEKSRIADYFTQDESPCRGNERLELLMDEEWKTYITNRAMAEIRHHFSPRSIEIFELSLKGAETHTLARQFELKENSIRRIKNRVKDRLIIEISELRKDLES